MSASPDNWLLLVVGIGGPLAGGVLTYLGTKVTAKPTADQALTAKFTALVDRQERERRKLEAVAADLEFMVVKLIAWADDVSEVAEAHEIHLPPRPRFTHAHSAEA